MRPDATIGRWSARHPWPAIIVWVAFVSLALAGLAVTGTKSLWNGSVGESAHGYNLMSAHGVWPPSVEYGYLHSATLRVSDPAFRSALADVEGRMQSRLRRRDGAPGFGRPPLGDRRPDPRHGSAVAPLRARLRARGLASSPAGDDRRSRSVHGERRSRPRREPRPAPGGAAFDTRHALRAALRVRVDRRGGRSGGAGSHGGRRRLRSARADQPGLPARRRRQSRRAPDRDGRRRGLRPLLRRPLTRGAKPRSRVP